jgi:hypothetical protein
MKRIVKSLAAVGLMAAFVSAATMEETVSEMGAAAGKAYMAPIVSGFGANMNAGWYHNAPKAQKLGFHVELGTVFMGTFLSGGKKTLNVTGSFTLDSARAQGVANASVDTSTVQGKAVRDSLREGIRRSQQDVTFDGPTIIGSDDDVMTIQVVSQPVTFGKPGGGDTTIQTMPYNDSIPEVTGLLGDYTDIPLPLFAPQLTLGTVYGTNLTLRWLPEIETNEDIGKVKFFGFGIQHNPAVWGFLPPLPLDVSLGYFTQSLKVGTLFEARSQAFNINASKQFGFRFLNVTPYGGIQYETSTFDFSYDLDVDGEAVPVKFSVDGANKYRATAGVSIRLLAININGDYNLGKYQSFSAGVMVGL